LPGGFVQPPLGFGDFPACLGLLPLGFRARVAWLIPAHGAPTRVVQYLVDIRRDASRIGHAAGSGTHARLVAHAHTHTRPSGPQHEVARPASPRQCGDLAGQEFLPQRGPDLGRGRGLGQATGEAVVLLHGDRLPQIGNFLDP
jgi:hypothetical protein